MNRHTQAISHDMTQLAEDARALIAATSDLAGEKVGEARDRLARALDRGREVYGRVRDRTAEGVRATDEAVRQHPYEAVTIAVGIGAILGYLVARGCSGNRD